MLGSLNAARSTVIVECHSPYHENLGYLRRLDPRVVRAILVPSQHQRETVLQALREPIPTAVIANPIGRMFLHCADSVIRPESDPIVLWVGRLDPLKNWEFFLRLAEGLLRRGSPAQYWIAGDTQDEGVVRRLYREAKKRRLLPRLRWVRQVRHESMPAMYAQVRASGGLVVSTSRNESFGMAVAEAMAVGDAVLAPRQGPFPELIAPDQTGRLYEPDDLASAQQKAIGLLEGEALRVRLGMAARVATASRFAPEAALKTLAAELRSIVAASSGRAQLL